MGALRVGNQTAAEGAAPRRYLDVREATSAAVRQDLLFAKVPTGQSSTATSTVPAWSPGRKSMSVPARGLPVTRNVE